MKSAAHYFNNHEEIDILYFTSDKLAFFEEQDAINHAASLEDDTITQMTREEVDEQLSALADEHFDDEPEYDPLDELDAE